MDFDWKKVAAKIVGFAPMVGTLLGGPLGGAAGGLVKLLANELGLKEEEMTPENVYNALEANPDLLLKLKEFELNHKLELQKLILESDRLEIQDRADARSRQVESEKATGRRDVNLYVLAYLFVIGFFLTIIIMTTLMFLGKIPSDIPQFAVFLLGNLFGTLSAGVGAVVQYFFGSSKGSSEKQAEIMTQFKALLSAKGG